MAPAEDKSVLDEGAEQLQLPTDSVDMSTFGQILEMDEDDHDFSSSIVFGFFEQAEETFKSMDEALEKKDLKKLAERGHFLKGSSATLGLIKVQEGCHNIERYGKKENIDGTAEPDSELCLERITEALKKVKADYSSVESALKAFYGKSEQDNGEDA